MREIFVESELQEFPLPAGFSASGGDVSVGEPVQGGRARAKPLFMHRLLAPDDLTQEALFVYRNWKSRRCYPDPRRPQSPLWWVVDGESDYFIEVDGERRRAQLAQIPESRLFDLPDETTLALPILAPAGACSPLPPFSAAGEESVPAGAGEQPAASDLDTTWEPAASPVEMSFEESAALPAAAPAEEWAPALPLAEEAAEFAPASPAEERQPAPEGWESDLARGIPEGRDIGAQAAALVCRSTHEPDPEGAGGQSPGWRPGFISAGNPSPEGAGELPLAFDGNRHESLLAGLEQAETAETPPEPERVSIRVTTAAEEDEASAPAAVAEPLPGGKRSDPFRRSLDAVLVELTRPMNVDAERQGRVAVRVVTTTTEVATEGPMPLPSRPELVSSDFLAAAEVTRPALMPNDPRPTRRAPRLPGRAVALGACALVLFVSLAFWLLH